MTKTVKPLGKITFKVLTNVGTFLYEQDKSESHFCPIDSELYFTLLLSKEATVESLVDCLFSEFDLTHDECIQINADTLNSLESKELIEHSDVETKPVI